MITDHMHRSEMWRSCLRSSLEHTCAEGMHKLPMSRRCLACVALSVYHGTVPCAPGELGLRAGMQANQGFLGSVGGADWPQF